MTRPAPPGPLVRTRRTLRRAWTRLRHREPDDPAPMAGIAVVVAATALVLAVGFLLALAVALVY